MPEKPGQRVLLFSRPFQVRGSSSYTLRLAEHLQSHEFDVRVVTSDASRLDQARRAKLPIDVHPYMEIPLWGRLVLKSLVAGCEDEPPALIHIQSRQSLANGTRVAQMLNVPYVVTIHDVPNANEKFRIDAGLCQGIIAVSHHVKEKLCEIYGLPQQLITVIHPGVEEAVECRTLPVLDPGHVPVIGTAGPLEVAKGIPYFLIAASQVLKNHPDVQFLVAGAGPEESRLRRLADDLKITASVTFIPNMTDFQASLSAMDIFCLPSLQQGLGAIMLEAMALAKPVIASDVGGVYSVICDNETGLLVPPSDSTRLSDRIQELLNDPVRARAIAESGRQLIRNHFNVATMVNRTVTVYRRALETAEVKDKAVSG